MCHQKTRSRLGCCTCLYVPPAVPLLCERALGDERACRQTLRTVHTDAGLRVVDLALAELTPDVEQHNERDEEEAEDQDGSRPDLETRGVVGVEPKDALATAA